MSRPKKQWRHVLTIAGLAGIALAAFCVAPPAVAQGSRKDDVVFNAQGRPMAGATVRVCTSAATGQPCSPLAQIYSDPGLTQALANPISTDGLGNYTFYASPGRYEIEISGPSITTKQLPNVIIPSDPTSPTFTTVTTTSGITAFSLSLSGNLTVTGSAAVTGSLSVGGAPVPSTTAENQWSASQHFKGPNPWRDFSAYMKDSNGNAVNCSSTATDLGANTTGTISLSTPTTLTLAAAKDFKNGCGIAVLGAGSTPTIVTPPSGISLSSVASASNVVTVTSSGNHNLVVGSGNGQAQGVQVSGCANSAYNGTYPIASIPTTTTFTYNTTGSGTGSTTSCAVVVFFGYAHGIAGSTTDLYKVVAIDANMGYSAATATAVTVANANATLSKYNYNHIMWAEETGAVMYAVYANRNSGGYNCVGTAFTNGFSDMGFNWPCPAFVPSTPPASPGADALNTTITAGGGTTGLTLAAAATTAVNSANVYHDESSFLTACVNDAKTDQSNPANNQSGSYGCYIPYGSWWINGQFPTATVATNGATGVLRIRVAGNIVLRTMPWFFNYGQYSVEGLGGGGGGGSFNYGAQAAIQSSSNVPAIAVFQNPAGGDINFNNFSLGRGSGVGQTGIWATGGGFTFDNDFINVSSGGESGFHFEGVLGMYLDHDSILGSGAGGPATLNFTTTQYNAVPNCCVTITNLFTNAHGLSFSMPGGNGTGSAYNNFSITNWLQENGDPTDNALIQEDSGPNAPGAVSSQVSLTGVTLINDAESDLAAANSNLFGILGTATNSLNSVQAISVPMQQFAVCVNITTACNGSNRLTVNNLFSAGGPTKYTYVWQQGGGFIQDSGYGSLNGNGGGAYANVSLGPDLLQQTNTGANNTPAWAMVLPPPSALTVASTGAGSLAAGTYCIGIAGVDNTGLANETNLSNIVCQAVGASSSIVLNWSEGIGNNMFFAYSQFNLYYCFVASGTCDPNTTAGGSTFKISNAGSGHGPVAYTFTSAGTSGSTPNPNNLGLLSWFNWDYGTNPASCLFCVSSHSDQWPIGIGVLPTKNVGINLSTATGIKVGATTFSTLATCAGSLEGTFRAVTDSTTSTWGATITGSGANHVLAYCDGTNWTVAAK